MLSEQPDQEATIVRLHQIADAALERAAQKLKSAKSPDLQTIAGHQIDIQSDARAALDPSSESREKFKHLTSREIMIDPEHPEQSSDLIQMERLHNTVLVSDVALKAFKDGDYDTVRDELQNGGLFDRFEPFDDERTVHEFLEKASYISVKQHLINDILNTNGKPGSYHAVGLFDANGVMHGYFSFRLPPAQPADPSQMPAYEEEKDRYVRLLEEELMTDPELQQKKGMDYKAHWDINRMHTDFPEMMLIDTIVVEKEYRKAGTYILLRNALQFIKDVQGAMPKTMATYLFQGFPVHAKDGQLHPVGPNLASGGLFFRLGFTTMAERLTEGERFVRRLDSSDDTVQFSEQPWWAYLYRSVEGLCTTLTKRMRQEKVLGENEQLLS